MPLNNVLTYDQFSSLDLDILHQLSIIMLCNEIIHFQNLSQGSCPKIKKENKKEKKREEKAKKQHSVIPLHLKYFSEGKRYH